MTRLELLDLLLRQAHKNGFEFRKWYVRSLGLPWEGSRQATELLSEGRRYYALLFSHAFAESFWKAGQPMNVQVPKQTFQRRMADGTVGTVNRKGFTRRVVRPDAWTYHLGKMATADDPLRYIRRFLPVQEDLDVEDPPSALDQVAHDSRFIIDEEDLQRDDDFS